LLGHQANDACDLDVSGGRPTTGTVRAGNNRSTRALSTPIPSSIPARCVAVKRFANCAVVVDAVSAPVPTVARRSRSGAGPSRPGNPRRSTARKPSISAGHPRSVHGGVASPGRPHRPRPARYPTPDPPLLPQRPPHDQSTGHPFHRSRPDDRTHGGALHASATQAAIASDQCPSLPVHGCLRKHHFPSSEGISTSKTRPHPHPTHGFGSEPGRVMRHPPRPIVGTTVDWRTALDRAKDELTGSLRCGDATTVAAVIWSSTRWGDITPCAVPRRLNGSLSVGWPQSLDVAATRAGLRLPESPVVQPVPDRMPEDNLRLFGQPSYRYIRAAAVIYHVSRSGCATPLADNPGDRLGCCSDNAFGGGFVVLTPSAYRASVAII
jgi:hypothetical protein